MFITLCLALPVSAQEADLTRQYYNDAKKERDAGRLDEAILLFTFAQEIEKERTLPRPELLIPIMGNTSLCYFRLGQYTPAINVAEEIMALYQEAGYKEGVAEQHFWLGQIYRTWGKYNLAVKHFGESFFIFKDLGQYPEMAKGLSAVGTVYLNWGENEQALQFFTDALAINRIYGAEVNIAVNLSYIGQAHEAKGEYRQAIEYFLQALAIDKKLGRKTVAATASNLGICYEALGELRKAYDYFQTALILDTEADNQAAMARDLSHIGIIHNAWGQFDQALDFFNQALDIAVRLNLREKVARNYNNIGSVHHAKGALQQALTFYRKAHAIDEELGRTADQARDLSNIGVVHLERGEYDQAHNSFKKALAINRSLDRQGDIALNLNNLGMVYLALAEYNQVIEEFENARVKNLPPALESQYQREFAKMNKIAEVEGTFAKALESLQAALKIDLQLGKKEAAAIKYNNIGVAHFRLKEFDQAVVHFKKSVALKEELRRTANADARRDYLAGQVFTYQWLISSYFQLQDLKNVFDTIELSRAKVLTEQLAGAGGAIIRPSLEEIQAGLADDTAVLLFARVDEPPLLLLVVSSDAVKAFELDIEELLALLTKADANWQAALKPVERGLRITSLSSGTGKPFVPDFGLNEAIHLYRTRLLAPSAPLPVSARGFTVEKEPAPAPDVSQQKMGRLLYDFLLSPAIRDLENKKNLIIVPDGILGYLPFETLVDQSGKYLIENYHIRYVQSLAVMKAVEKRKYTQDRKALLAMGGAVYEDLQLEKQDLQESSAKTGFIKKVRRAIGGNRSLRSAYAALGMADWLPLPGTLAEVNKIAEIVPQTDLATGSKVNESEVKKMSADKRLRQYKVIHFATHGLVVPEIPELSALVLSQDNNRAEKEDGYLRMGEIARLEVEADFVNLSACQTGLGKVYGGEGVVGLPQAFLVAGANGLSVSLWQVADESTAQFMTSLYDLVGKEKLGYDQAMTRIKREFVQGRFGSAYAAPYYWAPFVYYGR